MLAKIAGLMIAGGIVLYTVRIIMLYLITGTTASENIFTYLVPAAIAVTIFIIIFMLIFHRKEQRRM